MILVNDTLKGETIFYVKTGDSRKLNVRERVGILVCIWVSTVPDKDNGYKSQSCS